MVICNRLLVLEYAVYEIKLRIYFAIKMHRAFIGMAQIIRAEGEIVIQHN